VQPGSWALAYLLLRSGILARPGDKLMQQAFTAAPVIALAMLIGFAILAAVLGIGLAVAALKRAERPRFLAYLALAANVVLPLLVLLRFRN
jgi:RsiW-degrading membrane proteinase PrsW (M82 family)